MASQKETNGGREANADKSKTLKSTNIIAPTAAKLQREYKNDRQELSDSSDFTGANELLAGINQLDDLIESTDDETASPQRSNSSSMFEINAPSLFAFNASENYSNIFSSFPGNHMYFYPTPSDYDPVLYAQQFGSTIPPGSIPVGYSNEKDMRQIQMMNVPEPERMGFPQQYNGQETNAIGGAPRWNNLSGRLSRLSVDDSLEEPLLPDFSSDSDYANEEFTQNQNQQPHVIIPKNIDDEGVSRYLWEQQQKQGMPQHQFRRPLSASNQPIGTNQVSSMGIYMQEVDNRNNSVNDQNEEYRKSSVNQPTYSAVVSRQLDNNIAGELPQMMIGGQPVCRYFLQGYCSRGDQCSYTHFNPALQQNNYAASQEESRGMPQYGDRASAKQSTAPYGTVAQTGAPPMMNTKLSPPTQSQLMINTHIISQNQKQSGESLPISPKSPHGSPSSSYNAVSNPVLTPTRSSGGSNTNLSSPRKRTSPENFAGLSNRFQRMDQVVGHVYRMCRDQHGCRFLQKKLEEADPRSVEIIFSEVYDHMVELMTDPFGNYLCQKLIEHCNNDQRLIIVQKVAPHLVTISKNMHGTRAVQKMIECLSSPAQVQLVIHALESSVVDLIQDLNGNHVIQRCLNRLAPADNQFVYNAVAESCMDVATHRHGCCVMQRCIDHASDQQKLQLIREITRNALALVQDPFGNYVVQYVLDLPFLNVKNGLIAQFCGHLAQLSTQKFSSNVIEKCLKVAEPQLRRTLIEEVMSTPTLQTLLRDPYGNYVVQTALGAADVQQRTRLVGAIRPLLSELRNTPYGKRIQNKILKEAGTHV